MPLQIGKTPIVVPRQHQFNEHVNDHQVEFARNVSKRMGTIIDVEDIETLGDIITNYDQIVASMGHGISSPAKKPQAASRTKAVHASQQNAPAMQERNESTATARISAKTKEAAIIFKMIRMVHTSSWSSSRSRFACLTEGEFHACPPKNLSHFDCVPGVFFLRAGRG